METLRQIRSRSSRQTGQAGLISLLVVMLIIGILAATIYPNMAGRSEYGSNGQRQGPATPMDRAYDTACTAYMSQVTQAAVLYRTDHNRPPRDLESLKPYGVTEEIINTPNCDFGLPKKAVGNQGTQGYGNPAAVPARANPVGAALPTVGVYPSPQQQALQQQQQQQMRSRRQQNGGPGGDDDLQEPKEHLPPLTGVAGAGGFDVSQ